MASMAGVARVVYSCGRRVMLAGVTGRKGIRSAIGGTSRWVEYGDGKRSAGKSSSKKTGMQRSGAFVCGRQ